ncbi:unnamed protein product [Sphagnum balticum]
MLLALKQPGGRAAVWTVEGLLRSDLHHSRVDLHQQLLPTASSSPILQEQLRSSGPNSRVSDPCCSKFPKGRSLVQIGLRSCLASTDQEIRWLERNFPLLSEGEELGRHRRR